MATSYTLYSKYVATELASYSCMANVYLLIAGNKRELNKLCTSLVNFEITIDDVLAESQTTSGGHSSVEKLTAQPKKKTAVTKVKFDFFTTI